MLSRCDRTSLKEKYVYTQSTEIYITFINTQSHFMNKNSAKKLFRTINLVTLASQPNVCVYYSEKIVEFCLKIDRCVAQLFYRKSHLTEREIK